MVRHPTQIIMGEEAWGLAMKYSNVTRNMLACKYYIVLILHQEVAA